MDVMLPRADCGQSLRDLPTMQIHAPRYGLTLTPWENWSKGINPDWWRSYNNVKHQRDQYFNQATLQNALNAMGALLALNFHLYRFQAADEMKRELLSPKTVTRRLKPDSVLLRLPEHFYDTSAVIADSFSDMLG
jgi:hypothetical protein